MLSTLTQIVNSNKCLHKMSIPFGSRGNQTQRSKIYVASPTRNRSRSFAAPKSFDDASKVKNIYRQPSTCSRPRSHSCTNTFLSDSRRKQFLDSLDLCDERSSDYRITLGGEKTPTFYENEDSSSRGRRNSILKIHDNDGNVPCGAMKKQTKFKQDVEVILYDFNDRASRRLSVENVNLKDTHEIDEDVYSVADIKEIKQQTNANNKHSCESNSTSQSNSTLQKQHYSDSDSLSQRFKETAFSDKSFEIVRTKDEENQELLKVTLHVKHECLRSKTSVKAMSGGKSLMVITWMNISNTHLVGKQTQGSGIPEEGMTSYKLVEKIALPVLVNPYGVRAFVLKTGELVIDAPIIRQLHSEINIS